MWLRTSLLHFALSDAILKHELSTENKAVDCPDLTKIGCTSGLGAHFCAQVQGLDLVLWSDTGTVPKFQRRYLKKGCVYISAQLGPRVWVTSLKWNFSCPKEIKLWSYKAQLKCPWRGITVSSGEQFFLGTMILQLEISSFRAEPFASGNDLQLICNLGHLASLRF